MSPGMLFCNWLSRLNCHYYITPSTQKPASELYNYYVALFSQLLQSLTLLGGICFLVESKCLDIQEVSYQLRSLLWQTISADNLAVAQMLLNWHPYMVNDADENGWTHIHRAAKMNASAMIHILCNEVAKKEAVTDFGNTPLLVAALAGSEEAVVALLAEKVSPNVSNHDGWTPVHFAAAANNANMIEMLHQHRGELQNNTRNGNSPLSLAVMNDSEGAVALLMKKDATLADWKNTRSWTALHLAASKNAPHLLQILCGFAEVNVNAFTEEGHTALAIAVMQACLQAAEVLLKAKANPDVPNTKGWTALHIAAEKDACNMVHLLCEVGANTEVQTVMENTPLCIAAMYGCSDAVAELLRQNANPNAKNEHEWCAIHYAAAQNADKMVGHIGQAGGANLDFTTKEKNTPLILAITHGAAGAAKALVGAGADVNAKGPKGWSAFHYAVNQLQDDLEFFTMLNDGGADVNAMCNECKTPLMLAVNNVSLVAVQALLDIRANPNLRDPKGWSALHMAAEAKETAEILQLIVKNGVNVNSMTNKGNTALALSVMKKSVGCAEALLRGKADPNMCDDHGWSPLHLAAERNYAEVVELLCSFGADPNVTNQQGYTPLVISVAKDSKEAARALLKNKANPNVQSKLNGWAALHFAAQEDNQDLCELLCDFKADLNVRTHENNSPLLIAALKRLKSMTSTLLRRKANVNAHDSHGWTALHCAAQKNADDVISLLCANSADVEARTDKGNTPLAIAAIHCSEAAAKQLIKVGADLNATNHDDWTPLCCAVFKGSHSGLVECLCSPTNISMRTKYYGTPGQKPASAKDGLGYLPIQIAVMKNHPTAVEVLSRYCDAKCIRDTNGQTLLHLAAKWNREQVAKQLLRDGHQSDITDDHGFCPIHVAALSGSTSVIETCLHHDIEMIMLQGNNGYSVLHCAAMAGHVAAAKVICSCKGVKMNALTDAGETPICLASIFTDAKAEMIMTLCSFGADVTIPDYYGDTALHFAVLRDDEKKARALLSEAPKLVNMAGASGEVPLHWAVKKSSSKMIDVLCEGKCDVNAGDQHGNTPLHFATAHTRDEAIVKTLLEYGAAPEKPNREGHTPLDSAASQDARNCFEAIYAKAENAYNIDKVFYNMLRVHEYVECRQMDKAGKLMSDSIPNVL